MRKNLNAIIPTLIFMIMLMVNLTPAALVAGVETGDFLVEVRLSGIQPSPPEKFEIKIEPEFSSNPMPMAGDKFFINGANTVEFPEITYTNVGIYKYKVNQKPGNILGTFYDDSEYYLKVSVTRDLQGNLKITKALRKNGVETSKFDKAIFTNRYPTPSIPPSPALLAKVKLRALKSLDEEIPVRQKFTFLLSDENGTILQTKNNEAQNIEFDEMEYDKVGTSRYYIREKVEVDGKYVYDNTEYEVIIKVSRNSNGDYEANTSYLINGTPFSRIPIFENKTVPGKLPDTGGEEPEPGEEEPQPEPGEQEPEPGELPDTGGDKPGPGNIPDTGVKPSPPELPKTGEAKSALPIVGIIMILGGVTLSLKRKTTK